MINPQSTSARLLSEIDAFLNETGMSQTAFGKAVGGDARLYRDMRAGRSVSLRMYDRVHAFMAATRRAMRDRAQPESENRDALVG